MNLNLRVLVVMLAAAAFALGLYDIASPYRAGVTGYNYVNLNSGDALITSVYPQSPAARAGLATGDVIPASRLSPAANFHLQYHQAGDELAFPVTRGGKALQITLIAAADKSGKPVEEGSLALVVLLVFAATGVLAAFRGGARREARLLALFFVLKAVQMAVGWFGDVTTSSVAAFVANVLTNVAGVGFNYFLLLFVAEFPPVRSPLRMLIKNAALPIVALVALLTFWFESAVFAPRLQLLAVSGSPLPFWLSNLVWAVISLLLVLGAIEGLVRVDQEHKTQMRWVAIAMLLSQGSWVFDNVVALFTPSAPSWSPWMSLLQDVPMLALAYAVLRHRLVDLSIVVSRAAAFGFASLVLVAAFLVAESLAAQILQRGLATDPVRGWLGNVIPLLLAVAVGFSARPVHAAVERRLNLLFFANRERALQSIKRFASEADVVTEIDALFTLTFDCLCENTDGRFSAIYALRDGRYERARSTKESLPEVLGENDACIVRLRRWNEPFPMAVSRDALSEALLLPMTVRGLLLGILVCGPKRERTNYLSEEVDVLAQIAYRVGAAYDHLSRQPELDMARFNPKPAPA